MKTSLGVLNMDGIVFATILCSVSIPLLIFLVTYFFIRYRRFRFVGNLIPFVIAVLVICYVHSFYLKVFPNHIVEVNQIINNTIETTEISSRSDSNIVSSLFSSLVDAAKMFAFAFDFSKIAPFFKFSKSMSGEDWAYSMYGVSYLLASIVAVFFTSTIIVLTFFRDAGIKFRTFWRTRGRKNEICYIFSDPKVTIASRLGETLIKEGKVVIFYLSRASQKTQEGNEYKEMLLGKGFDVRVEKYGDGIAKFLFNKHFKKGIRKVSVFGLFSDDSTSLMLAESFQNAVLKNKKFQKIKRKVVFETDFAEKKDEEIQKFDKTIKDINELIGKLGKYNDDDKKALAALSKEMSQVLGINRVLNLKDKEIKEFVKNQSIHDGQFENVLSNFGEDIIRVVNPNKALLERWKKDLTSINLNIHKEKDYISWINNFRVFLTYHETDIDITHRYSQTTLHIVNTLSEYDMISSEFVLNNQITNFLDVKAIGKTNNNCMHVSFIGFGKINRPIFEKMTYAYQLWGDDIHKVHYHIVDQNSESFSETAKNLYTSKTKGNDVFKPPFLYDVTADLDGKDLTKYEVVEKYITKLFKKKNRFKEKGFEIFIVSLSSSTKSIQVASSIRNAIIKNAGEKQNLSKTIVFARVSEQIIADGYFNNQPFVKSQKQINDGLLVNNKDNSNNNQNDVLVPIVAFGQNALMSQYLNDYAKKIEAVGKSTLRSYMKYEKDNSLVEKAWLRQDKNGVLCNIVTVFSLKPKLELLEYELSDNNKDRYYIKKKDGSNAKTIDALDYNDEIYKQIAEFEHNRWLAASYLIFKYGQYNVDAFLNSIELNETTGKLNMETKCNSQHVCMLSNKGLKTLNERMKEYSNSEHNIEAGSLAKEAYKLTCTNDFDTIKTVFEDMKEPADSNNK